MIFWLLTEVKMPQFAQFMRKKEIRVYNLNFCVRSILVFLLLFSLFLPSTAFSKKLLQFADSFLLYLFRVDGGHWHMSFFLFDEPHVHLHQRLSRVIRIDCLRSDWFCPINLTSFILMCSLDQSIMTFLHEVKNFRKFLAILHYNLKCPHR